MWRHMSHIGCWISKDNEILTRFTLKEFNLCGRTLIQFVYISYFPIHLDVLAYMGHPYLYTSIITKMSACIPVTHHCKTINLEHKISSSRYLWIVVLSISYIDLKYFFSGKSYWDIIIWILSFFANIKLMSNRKCTMKHRSDFLRRRK